MTEKKNYITPWGLNRLTTERTHLLKVERPEMTKTVAWAASLGDRSENADYKYGKKRLREIDRRLRFLGKRIEASVVVDPKLIKADKVQFSATVIVENEEGEEKTYYIIGEDEIDVEKGFISWKSPIGKSLLGKSIGDEVIIRIPKGELELEIIDVKYIEHPRSIDAD
jgi:transcription elongation factor GreB